MDFLEKDLESIIYESSFSDLKDAGLSLSGLLVRQMKLGSYGVADLVYLNKRTLRGRYKARHEVSATIVELKKGKVNAETFEQAIKYARGVYLFLAGKCDGLIKIEIVLIGRNVEGPIAFAPNHVDSLEMYTYNYGLNGLRFDRIRDRVYTNKGAPIITRSNYEMVYKKYIPIF